jgi:hypothetical protein
MAGSSLLTLIDDIASVLDDVAVLTKVAAKKTAGVLGDDLALNVQQVSGVDADRELLMVWAVAKGSARNKAILVPAALAISAWVSWAVTPLLMVGGAFLCYEGFEKIAHRRPRDAMHGNAQSEAMASALAEPAVDIAAYERQKVASAVRTDFILSAEIIVITLGTVAASPFATQVAVLTGIAIIMTIGVYWLVAGIVKLDDAGLYLSRQSSDTTWGRGQRGTGLAIVTASPWLMKSLSIAGTAAIFLVWGGIFTHGIAALHQPIAALERYAATTPGIGILFAAITPTLMDAVTGIVAGAVGVGALTLLRHALPARRAKSGASL